MHRTIESWYTYGELTLFYGCANGVLITFFVEDRESFGECQRLFNNLRTSLRNVPIMCCGVVGMGLLDGENQENAEKPRHPRVVTEAEARAMCKRVGMEYLEVDLGADDGGVDAVFTAIIREMMYRTAPLIARNENTRRR